MTMFLKAELFQPRWRRMKEKPARKAGPLAKKPAARRAPDTAWPSVRKAHRVGGWK